MEWRYRTKMEDEGLAWPPDEGWAIRRSEAYNDKQTPSTICCGSKNSGQSTVLFTPGAVDWNSIFDPA